MPNTDLLKRVLTQIGTHPETWFQGMWAKQTPCGTTYCFAGHAVALSYKDVSFEFYNNGTSACATINPDTPIAEEVEIPDHAAHLLDLHEDEADALFRACNTLDELRQMVANLSEGREVWHGIGDAESSDV